MRQLPHAIVSSELDRQGVRILTALQDHRKLLYSYRDDGMTLVELYDLAIDPREQESLGSEGAERYEVLAQALDHLRLSFERMEEQPGREPSAQDIEALRALGYLQ